MELIIAIVVVGLVISSSGSEDSSGQLCIGICATSQTEKQEEPEQDGL